MPGRQYFRDSCVASPAPLHQQEYFNSFMASLIGETACGDHFRKPSNLVHVRAGRFSAGYYSIMNKMCQIIDLLPPDQMFYAGPIGKNQIRWIAVHGSSKLEGYHRWMNAQLSSGTTSPELAGALMCRHKWAVEY
ncbi:hypothetical protein WJX79_006863 [Trebouxia sp. C0005]